jgi:hypothetical protein
MSPKYFKLHYIIYAVVIYAEIFCVEASSSSSMDKCKKSLANVVFQMCAGDLLTFSDLSPSVTRVRGKRASLFLNEEILDKLAKQCCTNPCSITQLLEYCPENWWYAERYWLETFVSEANLKRSFTLNWLQSVLIKRLDPVTRSRFVTSLV